MTNCKTIYELTKDEVSRGKLLNMSDKEKLDLIMQLTDSEDIIEILYYIEGAIADAEWCQSYR